MKVASWTIALLVALTLGGCVATPSTAVFVPPRTDDDILVEVEYKNSKKAAQCMTRMKTKAQKKDDFNTEKNGQQCLGAGEADGFACGEGGKVIRWAPANVNQMTIEKIEFASDADRDLVCDPNASALENAAPYCTLVARPENAKGIAIKYTIFYTARSGNTDVACQWDPYVIVTRR